MWCDLWTMKLNASMTKSMIVSWSRTAHPQLTPLTQEGTVLKEWAVLVILGVTLAFDAKMTFDAALCFQCCRSEAWYHVKALASIS